MAGVDPATERYGFGTEFFAPAMVTTSLPGDAGQFLQRARCKPVPPCTGETSRPPARNSSLLNGSGLC